ELMQQYQVDPSQSSLTLAFSKVHAGRMSTCPPPSDSQHWDAPTLAQSRLVASVPMLQAPALPNIDGISALPPVMLRRQDVAGADLPNAERSSRAQVSAGTGPVRSKHRSLTWVLAGVVVLAALGGTAFFASRSSLSRNRWTPPTASQTPIQRNSKDVGKPKADTSTAPNEPSSVAAISFPADVVHRTADSASEAMQSDNSTNGPAGTKSKLQAPGGIPSSGIYRPRQISPYRPKGI
ncbi:MAG TPA: hypothetical protein VIV60_15410, partial [Polyangiaceae bacterium]